MRLEFRQKYACQGKALDVRAAADGAHSSECYLFQFSGKGYSGKVRRIVL